MTIPMELVRLIVSVHPSWAAWDEVVKYADGEAREQVYHWVEQEVRELVTPYDVQSQ